MKVVISWPERALWQNARVHWAERSRAVKSHRHEANVLARRAGLRKPPSDNPKITVTFHPPDRRKRDLQNMPATVKGALDGLADAMGVDDSTFRVTFPTEFGEVVKGGCVVLEVEP